MCLARHCIKYSLVFAYHFISGWETERVRVPERGCVCAEDYKTYHTHKSPFLCFFFGCFFFRINCATTDSPILSIPLRKWNHMGLEAGVNDDRFFFILEWTFLLTFALFLVLLTSFFVFVRVHLPSALCCISFPLMPLGQRKSHSLSVSLRKEPSSTWQPANQGEWPWEDVSDGTHGYSDRLEHLTVTLVRTEHWWHGGCWEYGTYCIYKHWCTSSNTAVSDYLIQLMK